MKRALEHPPLPPERGRGPRRHDRAFGRRVADHCALRHGSARHRAGSRRGALPRYGSASGIPRTSEDMEQLPVDLCTVADYDVLSGMLAPRPTLFIYNHADDCCFRTARARSSIVEPAGGVYSLLGAGEMMEAYDKPRSRHA